MPDCLLLDLQMPGINGLEVLKCFVPQHVPVPVLLMTGRDQPGKAQWVQGLSNIYE
jgi:CheY-like chemotaxis protein